MVFDDDTIRRSQEETRNTMYMLARNFKRTFQGHVKHLENIRCAGNKMFAMQDWTAAIGAYSRCITIAGGEPLEINGSDETEFNHVLMLAYSNRAEVRLRLQEFEEALRDADKALQITPKHLKTLVRKGKAAHGVGLFEKACKEFETALDISPESPSTVKLLRESTTAYEQSRTGNYDVTNCNGEIPSCADFVGPVEIRRATCGQGGRGLGLFATKSLEPGELLIVSNPLAVLREKIVNSSPLRANTGSLHGGVSSEESVVDLSQELCDKILRSKRQMASLYSLVCDKKPEVGFPSMKLFTPGYDWIPPGAERLELDMEFVYKDVAQRKRFHYTQAAGQRGQTVDVIGVWVLPAFAKHSCAPNCQHSFVGDTIFFRASRHITEGEELTITYFDNFFLDVGTRQKIMELWMFTCKCERCVFEKPLAPQLSKATITQRDLINGSGLDFIQVIGKQAKLSRLKKSAKAADEVEAVIQSLGTRLLPRQQAWIRGSYMHLYLAKNLVGQVTGLDPQSKMLSLKMFVSISSLYVKALILGSGAILLWEVDQLCTKDSQSYQDTLNQVVDIYKVFYGKQTNIVMRKLIEGNLPGYDEAISRLRQGTLSLTDTRCDV